LRGRGEIGSKGASSGDLFINVSVEPSREFTRENYNILSKKDIYFWQAALGDKVKVKTVDGEVNLKIPAGTPNNKIFILKGKGVPKLRGSGRGDHLVEVIVKIPKKLTREQKRLLEELRGAEI
jgi:molecular chaperone DnaJ